MDTTIVALIGSAIAALGSVLGGSLIGRALYRTSREQLTARRNEQIHQQRRRANAAVAAGLSRLQTTVQAIQELQFAHNQDGVDDVSAFQEQLESSIHRLMEAYHRYHAYLSEEVEGYFNQLSQSLIDSPAYAAQLVSSEEALRILRQNCGQGLALIKKEMRRSGARE